jgi:uncharacterized protein
MNRITVRVVPNAKTNEIVGYENGAWKIRLNAPPIEGRANEALIHFLAEKLDLAPSEIEIVKGQTSKMKIIEIPMHADDVEALLREKD